MERRYAEDGNPVHTIPRAQNTRSNSSRSASRDNNPDNSEETRGRSHQAPDRDPSGILYGTDYGGNGSQRSNKESASRGGKARATPPPRYQSSSQYDQHRRSGSKTRIDQLAKEAPGLDLNGKSRNRSPSPAQVGSKSSGGRSTGKPKVDKQGSSSSAISSSSGKRSI